MSNPWFRLYAEFLTDPKVQLMSETNQRRLVMIFCIRCNGSVTLQDKHVTFQLRISDAEWAITKAEFIANGFIDSDNNVLNWDKRQYRSDTSAARVAKHRTLHKNVTVTKCNVTVTPPDTDTDTDTEQIQNNKNITRKSSLSKLTDLGVDEQIAKDWLTIRKAKKMPLTDTALKQIKREAELAKLTIPSVIEICAQNNWAGFKSTWEVPIGTKTLQPFSMDNFMRQVNGK